VKGLEGLSMILFLFLIALVRAFPSLQFHALDTVPSPQRLSQVEQAPPSIPASIVLQDLRAAAKQVGISSDLLVAVCWVESNHRNVPVRMDGATPSYGVCQVKLETAEHMDQVFRHRIKATPARLNQPRINAFYAAKYLKYQLKRYRGDWKRAADAYNKGRAVSVASEYVQRVGLALASLE